APLLPLSTPLSRSRYRVSVASPTSPYSKPPGNGSQYPSSSSSGTRAWSAIGSPPLPPRSDPARSPPTLPPLPSEHRAAAHCPRLPKVPQLDKTAPPPRSGLPPTSLLAATPGSTSPAPPPAAIRLPARRLPPGTPPHTLPGYGRSWLADALPTSSASAPAHIRRRRPQAA